MPRHVRLRHHADERVDLVDAAVDRLQPGGQRRAPDAGDGVLLGVGARRVDHVARSCRRSWTKSRMCGSSIVSPAGSASVDSPVISRERRAPARKPYALPHVVVARHAVVAAAHDVVDAEIRDVGEATGIDHRRLAGGRIGRAGLRHLEQHAAHRVVDLLVVLVLVLGAERGEHATRARPAGSRSGLPNATDSGIVSEWSAALFGDRDPLGRERGQLRGRVVAAARSRRRTRRAPSSGRGSRRSRTRR